MKKNTFKKTALMTLIAATLVVPAYPKQTNAAYRYGNAKQKVVTEQMDKMARVLWRPSKAVTIGGKPYNIRTTYRGMPYTQLSNITYEEFSAKSQSSTGGFFLFYNDSLGNDCTTAVALAWKTYFTSIDYAGIWTGDFLNCARYGANEKYHMKSVGGYQTNMASTKDYCVSAGFATVKRYYQQLQPGDCLFKYYNYTNSIGENCLSKHAVLVVATSSTGVLITDQIGRGNGDNIRTTWRRKKRISFQDLYKQNYLPVYCTDVR